MAEIKRRRRRRLTAVEEGPSWDVSTCCLEPLCNVQVAAHEVVVTADLPYANPETIEVEQVGKRTLEIKAKMKRKINFKDFGITHRQGEFEFFRCQTRIPVPVDMKRMKKELKRDFLEVHLPRKKSHRTKVE
jgi:HSP20 family molecular chaperone IbpA